MCYFCSVLLHINSVKGLLVKVFCLKNINVVFSETEMQ